jgi:hypothetical protein
MGHQSKAGNDYSVAFGDQTTASGYNSTAMGYLTTASAEFSTAMGSGTTASGNISTVMGVNSTASGAASTAIGNGVTASGACSFAAGQYLTSGTATNTITLGSGAGNNNRLVNDNASSFAVGFNSTVPTLFVGPASGVGTYGNVGIGTTAPTQNLTVNGVISATGGTSTDWNAKLSAEADTLNTVCGRGAK